MISWYKFLPIYFVLFSINAGVGVTQEDIVSFDAINLSSQAYKFKLLGDLEGTSIILKVKYNGHTVAVFKPSSGSTNYRGEYASYKLGSLIGTSIYPLAKLDKIPYERLNELINLVETHKYTKYYGKRYILAMKRKEQNRKNIINRLKKLISQRQALRGVLKIWVRGLIFSEQYGTLSSFRKTKLYKILSSFDKIGDFTLRLSQFTRIMHPTGKYIWTLRFKQLVKDFSTMLVMDAILGNRDRFPGGNVHFATEDTSKITIKKNLVNLGRARLISIDNGAVLGTDLVAFRVLKKLKIKRFEFNKIKKLKLFFTYSKKTIMDSLGINIKEFNVLSRNAKKVFEYIDSLYAKYGNKIYIN